MPAGRGRLCVVDGVSDRRTTELLGGLIVCLVLAIALGVMRVRQADAKAAASQAVADDAARERVAVEAVLADMAAGYEALTDTVEVLRDSVDATMATMGRVYREAGARTDSLIARIEEVAGDSVATVAWADSLVASHAEETHALEAQLSVSLTLNDTYARGLARADAILAQQLDANELLRMEVTALRQTVAAWQAVARPGLWVEIRDHAALIGGALGLGTIVGAVAVR